ncbi:hypothetical protein, partial [Thiolapillus sp.]|uniref:hypothetical protein n=1 Tax=Thiolapillus sp. TaxID=2017437 RepID=UPI003AF6A829
AENSNRPIGEEVSRMQQSAYRTSSNGQYEQNSNFISPENIGSSAEFVGSRGGFEANDQVWPVGVEHPTRSLRRWSYETIINSEGTKWDAAQDYPEPGAEIQVICLQVGALGW